MVFDNAFCVNAICTPSRACIITGQYPHNNGVFDLTGCTFTHRQTLPILMREAGYQTAIIGKWHLKREPHFDYYKVLPGQGKYMGPVFRVQGLKPWPSNTVEHPGEHSSDAITDATLDYGCKTIETLTSRFFFAINSRRLMIFLKTLRVIRITSTTWRS